MHICSSSEFQKNNCFFKNFCCCLKFPVNSVDLFNLERQSKSFSTEAIKDADIVIKQNGTHYLQNNRENYLIFFSPAIL